jgi:hypothetical protein
VSPGVRFLGSLLPPALLFALFFGTIALVTVRMPRLAGVCLGIVAGACLVFGVLLAYWNFVDWANLRVIRRFTRVGDAGWDDGAIVAVEGVVRADGEPMVSPFTATPCAAYTYVVSSSRQSSARQRSVRVLIAQGFHLVPSSIDGAGRRLRLYALPGVEDELRRTEPGTTWGNEARRLVESLASAASPGRERQILSRLLEAKHVHTEEVRCDYVMGTIGKHADGLTIEEEVLPVGRTLCMVGSYDRERHGLTARRSRIGPNLMVYLGSAEDVLARVGKDVATYARVAIVLAGIGLAAVAYAWLPR